VHEVRLIKTGLERALADAPAGAAPGARPRSLEIRIRNPIHLGRDAAAFHADAVLRAAGAADVPVTITAMPIRCLACGAETEPDTGHPFCGACEFPLAEPPGPPLEVLARW
jgi:hypothetical protein